jgi:hypothetical protein
MAMMGYLISSLLLRQAMRVTVVHGFAMATHDSLRNTLVGSIDESHELEVGSNEWTMMVGAKLMITAGHVDRCSATRIQAK